MVLKLYIDPWSEPARSLMLFARANKLEAEEISVIILKKEHKTDEFKKINRFQKIPAIVHNDFQLAESVAILRYLARAFPVPDHWYPKDLQAQARVDEFMSWQHIGLRLPVLIHVVGPIRPLELYGTASPSSELLEHFEKKMDAALNDFEKMWLGRHDFIVGNEISIADLLAVGEIEMTRYCNFDATKGRPGIAKYLEKVREAVGAEIYDDVHTVIKEYQENAKAKPQQ